MDPGLTSSQADDMSSAAKQIDNLSRYVNVLEGKVAARIEVCENDVNMANQLCLTLIDNCNEVARNLAHVIKQVHELKNDWNAWSEGEDLPN